MAIRFIGFFWTLFLENKTLEKILMGKLSRGFIQEYKIKKSVLENQTPEQKRGSGDFELPGDDWREKINSLKEAVKNGREKLRGLKDGLNAKIGKQISVRRIDNGADYDKTEIDWSDNKEKVDESRRKFLKWAGGAALAGLSSGMAAEILFDLAKEQELREKRLRKGKKTVGQKNKTALPKEGESELKIEKGEKADFEVVEDILIEQFEKTGEIVLNRETKAEIRRYWRKQYEKGGRQHRGLLQALERMKYWFFDIKQEFKKVARETGVNIPEKLIYLAIPESHCKIEAKSSACAGGFYQLTKLAACDRSLGKCLLVDKNIDERFDPVQNGRRAAELLANWYKQIKTPYISEEGAWILVLTRYNGGYFNKFLKYVGADKELINYDNYLRFREGRLNDFLQKTFDRGYFETRVRKGDTLWKLARRFRKSVADIKRINGLKTDVVKKGDLIKIPVKKEKRDLRFLFKTYLKSSMENLNYPEKFLAILEVMEKEGLFLSERKIGRRIRRISGGGLSLRKHSQRLRIPLSQLRELNKHILDPKKPIPKNVEINIPLKS